MPCESIGSISTGQLPDDGEWIEFGLDLAKRFLAIACGPPPPGCTVETIWHDYELGPYPTIGVCSGFSVPWDYVNACQAALEVFDDAVDWAAFKKVYDRQVGSELGEDDGAMEDDN